MANLIDKIKSLAHFHRHETVAIEPQREWSELDREEIHEKLYAHELWNEIAETNNQPGSAISPDKAIFLYNEAFLNALDATTESKNGKVNKLHHYVQETNVQAPDYDSSYSDENNEPTPLMSRNI